MSSYYIEPHYFDIAKANGISEDTLRKRVYELGWDVERAATESPRQTTSRKEWRVIAEQNGIKYDTFLKRVNKYGWSEERAATEPTMSKQEVSKLGSSVKKNNAKLTDEIMKLAKLNGICISTLKSRIYEYEWNVIRAATEPIKTREQSLKEAREAYKRCHGHYWHEKTFS